MDASVLLDYRIPIGVPRAFTIEPHGLFSLLVNRGFYTDGSPAIENNFPDLQLASATTS